MFWLFKDPVGIMKEIMPGLFKDPINSGLAQFDHAQSNNWTENGPFAQMRFFSENLLMSPVSFIPAYLDAKNQSEISIY